MNLKNLRKLNRPVFQKFPVHSKTSLQSKHCIVQSSDHTLAKDLKACDEQRWLRHAGTA